MRRLVDFVIAERVIFVAALMLLTAMVVAVVALWLWNAALALVAGMYLAMTGEQLLRTVAESARPVSKEHRRVVRRVQSGLRQSALDQPEKAS